MNRRMDAPSGVVGTLSLTVDLTSDTGRLLPHAVRYRPTAAWFDGCMTESRAFPKLACDGRCPCLSGETYGSCCAPFHGAEASAPTAERLMRSRYSAYVAGLSNYLLETWDARTRPASLELDPGIRWLGLEIVRTQRGGMLDDAGIVEFIARFRTADGASRQHETSTFRRVRKRWVYVDAV